MAEKKYTVKTPNPHFTGVRNGVHFVSGEGKATYEQAEQLVNKWGYRCEEIRGTSQTIAPIVQSGKQGTSGQLRQGSDDQGTFAPEKSGKKGTSETLAPDTNETFAPVAGNKSSGFKKWQYAKELVKQIDTVEGVKAFVTGDPRKSVNKAAEERIAELNSQTDEE